MMLGRRGLTSRLFPKGAALLMTLMLILFFLRYLGSGSVTYREAIFAALGLGGIAVVLGGVRGVEVGLMGWVLTLGLGYRTIALTSYIKLHPSELFLWALALLLFLQKAVFRHQPIQVRLPLWIWVSIPFWVWGWVPGLLSGRRWDLMFSEFRSFLLLLPLYFVASHVLRSQKHWKAAAVAFFSIGAWVAALGILEWLFPEMSDFLPGYFIDPFPSQTAEGFLRAKFSFWGTPAATFICALAIPLAIPLWGWFSRRVLRGAVAIAAMMQIIGIILGGYRSIWLILGSQIALGLTLGIGLFAGVIGLAAAWAGRALLPSSIVARLTSLTAPFRGGTMDTSLQNRLMRAQGTARLAEANPWGSGWAGSGWAHSDFLQVSSNLGLLAGVVFAGGYLWTLFKIVFGLRKAGLRPWESRLGFSLFLSFIAAGGILAIEGVQVLPQLILPVWFVWMMTDLWIMEMTKRVRRRLAREQYHQRHDARTSSA
jgi:hypothetical protein